MNLGNGDRISLSASCSRFGIELLSHGMRILSRSTLRNFWESYPDAEEALKTWYDEASHADWQNPADVKTAHRHASIIANNRVVFNIKGFHIHLSITSRD